MNFPSLWTEERILSLAQESDSIDFKASAKLTDGGLKEGLSKWVGAFANGASGHVIFGIEDPTPGQPLKCDGGFPTNHKGGTREWLEDLVGNSVNPPPPRINVFEVAPIAGHHSRIKPGNALYVVEVMASNPPGLHQSPDGRYHLKVGSKTRVLGHEEILERSRRELEPAATVDVKIQPHQTIDSTLIVTLRNTGPVLIKDIRVQLLLPPEIDGVGCFSCDESEFLFQHDYPWIRLVIDSLTHPLHKDQVEVRKWHLEFQSGITFRGRNGDWKIPPGDKGHCTLWIGNQPPIHREIKLADAIIERLWFQPERKSKACAA